MEIEIDEHNLGQVPWVHYTTEKKESPSIPVWVLGGKGYPLI